MKNSTQFLCDNEEGEEHIIVTCHSTHRSQTHYTKTNNDNHLIWHKYNLERDCLTILIKT